MNTQGEVEEPEEVILDIRPGLWTEDCLNKAGNEARQALYQFGYLARDVLRIDAYRNELALRLAIHLTLESRFHPTGLYQVKTLLEAIQPHQVIEEACEDREKRRALKQKWDAALNLLKELSWHVSFDDSYLPEWQPGAKQSSRSGYFRDLLNAKILIRPPEPIPQLIQRASTGKGLKGSTSASLLLVRQQQASITPDQIKKARQKHKITQAELGKHLGTTKGWISHIENQRKTLTQDKAREMLAAIEYLSTQRAGKGKR
jgi:DNA-binding transcriptional regulator YiaG